MTDLRILCVQMDIFWESPEKNIEFLTKTLDSESVLDADVILLPEMFTTGFSMDPHCAEEEPGMGLLFMQALSKRTHAAVGGSIMVKVRDTFYNRFYWVTPDGSYDTYDKRHLFRMAGEHQVYTAGSEYTLIEWKGWKLLPLICYDLRFPVWSRNRLQPTHTIPSLWYDVVLYVANFPSARSKVWDTLLCARAMENSAYSIGVNRVGTDGMGITYSGGSAVIDPKGELLWSGEKNVCVGKVNLSWEKLIEYRTKFPAHLDADEFNLKA